MYDRMKRLVFGRALKFLCCCRGEPVSARGKPETNMCRLLDLIWIGTVHLLVEVKSRFYGCANLQCSAMHIPVEKTLTSHE